MDYIRHIIQIKSKKEKWVIDENNRSFNKWLRNQIDAQLKINQIIFLKI